MFRAAPFKPRMATPSRARDASSGVFRFSVAYFLVALVLLYVTAPFVQSVRNGILIEAVLVTLVLLSAVLAVSGRRRTLWWAIGFAVPTLVEKWVNYWRPDLLPPQVSLGAGLVFIGFIVLRLLDFILRAPRVNAEILCAGVATYLLLGLLWAFAYLLVERLVPDSFAFTFGSTASRSLEGFNSLYFSITTLATSGYGDIVPVSGLARMLAMTESMVGLFYVTLLIARLVALYSSQGPSDDASEPLVLSDHRLAADADGPKPRSESQQILDSTTSAGKD
ncbi:MAG: ion channel [Candidatus Contendobacter sp.]|nr:ion channel [Candidatus Contendobacter sp.]MDS4059111.1 ion channel [Candidatus Contendobacter sp.]